MAQKTPLSALPPLDLRWGDPTYLSKYWQGIFLPPAPYTSANRMGYRQNAEKETVDLLVKVANGFDLIKYPQNIREMIPEVVIGNGSSQLLTAAIAVMGKDNYSYSVAPSWGRFGQLSEIAGVPHERLAANDLRKRMLLTDRLLYDPKDAISPNGQRGPVIYTSPNNPDGIRYVSKLRDWTNGRAAIHDLNYNWPHYTDRPSPAPISTDLGNSISIYGLTKLSGFASVRFGWAYTYDKPLAEEMRKYIELATCGVGIEAQSHAHRVIEHIYHNGDYFFDSAKKILKPRFKELEQASKTKMAVHDGMFYYAPISDSKLAKIKVLGIRGNEFGDSDRMVRLNLGCSDSDFKELIRRFKEIK